jgi:branched-chain amino acid transport system permease protein
MYAMVIGGAIGGIGGALSAEYLTGWSTTNWITLVTFTYFTGIILGGAGNNLGVAFGIALIPVGFREITRLLPPIGYPGLIEALQWVAIGILTLLVLYIRPSGIIPEKFIRFDRKGRADAPINQGVYQSARHFLKGPKFKSLRGRR